LRSPTTFEKSKKSLKGAVSAENLKKSEFWNFVFIFYKIMEEILRFIVVFIVCKSVGYFFFGNFFSEPNLMKIIRYLKS